MNKEQEKAENRLGVVLRALDAAYKPFGVVEEMELHGTMTLAGKLENAASFKKEELEEALELRRFERRMCEGQLCWVVFSKESRRL